MPSSINKNLKTFTTAYKEEFRNKDSISCVEYTKINQMFAKFIFSKLMQSKKVNLPYHLGTLEIIGKKLKSTIREDGKITLPVDWGSTRKLWDIDEKARKQKTLLYHTNEHSNGFVYRMNWSKQSSKVPNRVKSLIKFVTTKTNRVLINKAITEGKEFRNSYKKNYYE